MWDDYHIFNRNACLYQTATRWDLPPYQITIWVIDWWCNVCLFTWWIDTRFCYSDFTLETGGFELVSTITLALHANRLTKCASHLLRNDPNFWSSHNACLVLLLFYIPINHHHICLILRQWVFDGSTLLVGSDKFSQKSF